MSITFHTGQTDGPGVNMANANAAMLIELLGLPVEPIGEEPAEDFLGRTLIAQALLDVTTDDEHGTPTVQDGWMTYCGQPPGYRAMRLAELQEVATWALTHQVPVLWD